MIEQLSRFCILGAGAIGLDIGCQLISRGHHVSFVARGDTLLALRNNGIVCHGSDDAPALVDPGRFQCSDHAADLGSQDVVFLSVKSQSLLEVAEQLAPLLGVDTLVITATNGVPPWFSYGQASIERHLLNTNTRDRFFRFVSPKNLLGSVVDRNVTSVSPAVIRRNAGRGLRIGELDHSLSPRLFQLRQAIQSEAFEIFPSEDIHRDIWHKLLVNVSLNPCSVVYERSIGEMMGDSEIAANIRNIVEEVHELGVLLGIVERGSFDVEAFFARFQNTRKNSFTSMYQDFSHGRPLELNRIVEVVLYLANLPTVNHKMPKLSAVLAAVRPKTPSGSHLIRNASDCDRN